MASEQAAATSAGPRRRLLLRGESAVASIGIALAAILICTLAATAWWSTRVDYQQSITSGTDDANQAARLLSESVESMLAAGDLSSVRRLIAAQNTKYVRVVLPDGAVIADRELSKITLHDLPENWPGRAGVETVSTQVNGAVVAVRSPLHIPGRGAAELQLGVGVAASMNWVTERLMGLGVISVAALGALLLVYRQSRARLRAMGAIREALLAVENGEQSSAALTVSADLGHEAAAWNGIVGETEKLRKSMVVERARESLDRRRAPRSELDQACDAMSQGIILLDDKLRVKYVNGAAGVFLQADRTKLVNAQVMQAIKDEEVKQMLTKWEAEGSRRRMLVECKRSDEGAGVLRWSVRPVRREDGGGALIGIEDITQQRVAEESRNAFVAQATHELRTPLTNIRLYLETAIDEGEKDATVRAKCLNVINTETRRLERIVTDMLSTAQIESGSLKVRLDDVRLDEVFEELRVDYAAQAEDKQLKLAFNLPPKLPVVKADRDLVLLALHNLLGNALKYTPAGGSVTVNVEADEKQLSVDIVDTGLGISEADQQRLFEKFYRAQDRRIAGIVGTGLGLALAREVVRLHGGDITLQSVVDKGSTFSLKVPVGGQAA